KLKATYVQYIKCDKVSFADLAEYVFHRHMHILEEQRACRGAFYAHLMLLWANTKPFHVAFDDKGCKLVTIDLGIHDKEVSKACVRNKDLRAIQNIMRTVLT